MASAPFLTPSVRALLNQVNGGAVPPDYSPAAQRAGLNGAMAALGWSSAEGPPPECIALRSGATAHLFRPPADAAKPHALIVYLHGGSFMAGGLASHGDLARELARRAGAAVALVDYRLAPESRAPAALDDCVDAVVALRERSAELGLDGHRIALLGDSAGGALAAATALRLRDDGLPAPLLVVLVNPMISPAATADTSMREFATGYFAGAEDFEAGWRVYDNGADSGAYFDLFTAADLRAFPPVMVVTNEADPVRDQGETFATRLSEAGSPALLLRARGLVHASWLFPKALPEADLLVSVIAGTLGTALQSP